jgi:hypothetical protein
LADSTLVQDFKMAVSVVPSPFERIQAARFAAGGIDFLIEQAQSPEDVRGIANLMSQPELPHANR